MFIYSGEQKQMFKIADFSRQTTDNPLKSDSDPVSKLWALHQLYHPVLLSLLAMSCKKVTLSYTSAQFRSYTF